MWRAHVFYTGIMLWCVVAGYAVLSLSFFFFQAEDGIRDLVRSRGLGDVYKRQAFCREPLYSAEGLRQQVPFP